MLDRSALLLIWIIAYAEYLSKVIHINSSKSVHKHTTSNANIRAILVFQFAHGFLFFGIGNVPSRP